MQQVDHFLNSFNCNKLLLVLVIQSGECKFCESRH
jgi:hypothetical protein